MHLPAVLLRALPERVATRLNWNEGNTPSLHDEQLKRPK
jgi:hypothetical protein